MVLGAPPKFTAVCFPWDDDDDDDGNYHHLLVFSSLSDSSFSASKEHFLSTGSFSTGPPGCYHSLLSPHGLPCVIELTHGALNTTLSR